MATGSQRRRGTQPPSADPIAARKVRDLVARCVVLLQTEQPDIAQPILDDALKLDPNNADVLLLKGRAHILRHQYPDALRYLRRALKRRPTNIDTLLSLSRAHDALGNHRQSENALQDALKAQPGDVRAVTQWAHRLQTAGKAEQAVEFLEQRRGAGMAHPEIDISLAAAFRALRRNAEGIDAARRASERTDIQVGARRGALFLLGHMLDAEGDYDNAFAAFRRANETTDSVDATDPKKFLENWSADRMRKLPFAEENRSDLPVLVVGMPRSGTTITEQILAAHPVIETIGEGELLSRLVKEYPPASLDGPLLTRQGRRYLNRLSEAAKPGTKRVVDKMPENFFSLGFASRTNPGVRVVHCTRDARDTCLSCYFQNFDARITWSRRLSTSADQFIAYHEIMRHYTAELGLPILEWNNEALSADAQAMIPDLLDFVGVSRDERAIDFKGSKRAVHTASTTQVRDGVRKSRPPRWKNYEKHIGPMLERLEGY